MSIFANLPSPTPRTRGTLITSTDEITENMLDAPASRICFEGISLLPWFLGGGSCAAANCTIEYSKTPEELPDWVTQKPFLLWDALECSNLGGVSELIRDRVLLNVDGLRSHVYAQELETAACSGGIGLIGNAEYDPENTGDPQDFSPDILTGALVPVAFEALEAWMADRFRGALGTIHVTAAILSRAQAEDLVRWDNARGVFRTATGHIVIGDSGHTGQATPTGGVAPGANQAWIYATSDVWYWETPVDETWFTNLLEAGRRPNRDRFLAERHALLAFDPSNIAAVLVDAEVAA